MPVSLVEPIKFHLIFTDTEECVLNDDEDLRFVCSQCHVKWDLSVYLYNLHVRVTFF